MAAVLGGAALLAAACGGSSPSSGGSTATATVGPQKATVANLRLAGPGSTNNNGYPTPYGSNRGPGKLLTAYVFDQLAWPDSSGVQKPWLAQSWTTSADGKTWTFTLRSNAVWQDGTPLTAADVVFSYTYVMPGGAANKVAPAPKVITSVTSPSANTVVMKLSQVDPTFLDEIGGMSGVFIVPQHIWASVTDPLHFQGAQALIGSGPYKLTSFDLSQGNYQYTANNQFYLGKPVVQQVTLTSLPANADPLVALQKGTVDAASAPNSNGGVPNTEVATLQKQFTMLTARGEFTQALYFNLEKGFPYNSTAFRQAVSYAINRPDILKREVNGRGVPGSAGGLGPANPWLNKDLPAYDFNQAKAKTLLDQIGIVDTDGNGIRNLPGGGDLHLPIIASSSSSVPYANLVKEYLGAVGLQVDVTALDQASTDAATTAGNYSLAVIHFGGLSADPYTRICTSYTTVGNKFTFTSVHGYNNPAVTSLCSQLAVTTDHDTRQSLANQLQAVVNNDVPVLPLYVPDQVAFVNTKVYTAWAYTTNCPPCDVSENKLILSTGKLTIPSQPS